MHQGLIEGIDLAVHLKFGAGPEADKLIEVIENIKYIDRLKAIKNAILESSDVLEQLHILI